MIRLLASFGLVLSLVATASAQITPGDISITAFNPGDATAPASTIEGRGIKVGEGTVLRPVFGAETGFVSNVFYEEDDAQPAGVLRLIAQIGTASLGAARLHPSSTIEQDDPQENLGQLEYRANLRLSYDFMLAEDNTASETGGLGIGASLHGMVNPMGRLSFGFGDDFVRLIRAANFETDSNTNRDINHLRLLMLYRPRDSAISGFLYYENRIDIFERDEQSFADRMTNRVGLHPQWRFLPQTQAYLDLSIANVTALDSDSQKVTSYPLVVRAGISTLLTVKTTLNLDAGYTNGFYDDGPSFSAPTIGAMIGYRYNPLGRVTAGYSLTYEDSINANYFRDHVLRASWQHIVNPVIFMVQPEVHFRQYRGVTFAVPGVMGEDTRNDVIFAVVGGVHYNFRRWLMATLNYRFTSVSTDYMYSVAGGTVDDPSYARHELLLGMRVAL
ncbi:MAG: outer membrane beta-barrel protein [Deltaproteobacteria bacterium]|nr:outer membrane beta-barrel protein [Deltaproteobacteria bacterium]MDQ3297512.1 hypothetical protein [Myxococcota bacterium]